MTIVKTYIAEDGTKFDSEWECADYEDKLRANKFADTALLFDVNGERMPLSITSFEMATYIIAKTQEAAAYMAKEFSDWENPWYNSGKIEAGCWVFYGDGWKLAEEVVNIANIIKKIS